MLSVVAQGSAWELSDEAADDLLARLRRSGVISRDPATGDVLSESPMIRLASALETAREIERPYGPSEDEQTILYVTLDSWLVEVSEPTFPKDAMNLRYALFGDIDDRHRQRATAPRAS